jgi:hypothetical protein
MLLLLQFGRCDDMMIYLFHAKGQDEMSACIKKPSFLTKKKSQPLTVHSPLTKSIGFQTHFTNEFIRCCMHYNYGKTILRQERIDIFNGCIPTFLFYHQVHRLEGKHMNILVVWNQRKSILPKLICLCFASSFVVWIVIFYFIFWNLFFRVQKGWVLIANVVVIWLTSTYLNCFSTLIILALSENSDHSKEKAQLNGKNRSKVW